MKAMKKIFAVALALMLVFSMALTANAETDTVNVNIQNAQVGKTYNVYKLLNEHTQTTSGIVYKSTEAWKDFWKQTAITVGESTVDITEYVTLKTEGENLIVIPKANFESKAAIVAQAAAKYAATNNIANVGSATGAETTSIELDTGDGYYLMTSSTGNLCALSHIEKDGNLILREKNTPSNLPAVNKTITDEEGTAYNVGDTVRFEVVIDCEENATEYILHDVMNGMTLNNDIAVNYNGVANMSWAKQAPTETENKCTFEIKVNFEGVVKAYDKVVITYSATVTEDSVEGMSNTAYLEGVTSDVVVTKEHFTLKKTDGNNNVLEGAEFELYYLQASDVEGEDSTYVKVPVVYVEDGNYYRPAGTGEEGTAIVAGEVLIKGLVADKDYFVKETKAPAGYVPIDGYQPVNGTVVTVENTLGQELPETGGMGTTMFYALGGLMVAAAVILLVSKKRMSAM